jgi:CO/xanthine dehydrogenase FAD-binding subunit
MLPKFQLTEPRSLDEALALMAEAADRPIPLAGGTNLLVDLRNRGKPAGRLAWLGRIPELRRLEVTRDRVVLGARTTITDLLRRTELEPAGPSLVQSGRLFAGHMIRNAATVGGNVCYGSPAADMVPPLLSLDAELTLASRSSERTVPLHDFLIGYKATDRRPDEILTTIAWPRLPAGAANLFHKLGLRKGDAITVVAVAVTIAAENGHCSLARVALGAVGPTVFRAKAAERTLEGERLTPAVVAEAARRAAEACRPIDDLRASADYRQHTAEVLVRRLVQRAWDQAGSYRRRDRSARQATGG